MKRDGHATIFLFLFLFSRSLASLISLCWCHYAESQEVRGHKSDMRTLADQCVWRWLVRQHPLPPPHPLLSAHTMKNGQAGTWKCQHVELWQAWSHNSCPCSTQSILSIRSNEKQSGKDQQLGAGLFTVAFLVRRFNHTGSDFSACVHMYLKKSPEWSKAPVEGKKKKNPRKTPQHGQNKSLSLRTTHPSEQVASGFISRDSRCRSWN